MTDTKIAIFKGKEIRKTIYKKEWWFVVEEVVFALTDSNDPKQYINRMRQRDPELAKRWVQFVYTLSIETSGGGPTHELWNRVRYGARPHLYPVPVFCRPF